MRRMSLLIALGFVGIVASLGAALYFMMSGARRDAGDDDAAARSRRMAWALTARVALSVALFLAMLLAWQLGWLHPSGLPASR